MTSIKLFLQSASGWLRLWLVATFIWLVASIAYVAQSFPTEEAMRADYNHGARNWLDFTASQQDILDGCSKFDDLRDALACQRAGRFSEHRGGKKKKSLGD